MIKMISDACHDATVSPLCRF